MGMYCRRLKAQHEHKEANSKLPDVVGSDFIYTSKGRRKQPLFMLSFVVVVVITQGPLKPYSLCSAGISK